MSTCRKCGHSLKFIRKPGKYGQLRWWPVDLDGGDHFDRCREYQTQAMTAEQLEARRIRDQLACPPMRARNVKHVYCGTVPPWDESLGEFRGFTKAEITEKIICRRD